MFACELSILLIGYCFVLSYFYFLLVQRVRLLLLLFLGTATGPDMSGLDRPVHDGAYQLARRAAEQHAAGGSGTRLWRPLPLLRAGQCLLVSMFMQDSLLDIMPVNHSRK